MQGGLSRRISVFMTCDMGSIVGFPRAHSDELVLSEKLSAPEITPMVVGIHD